LKHVGKKYRPDFLVKRDTGKTLVLEVKEQQSRKDIHRRNALAEWVGAVNDMGE